MTESPHDRIIRNVDEFKMRKRSNLYQPKKIISIPGTQAQPLISCYGGGDAEKYNLLNNQKYQIFDQIPLYSKKFKGKPGTKISTKTQALNRRQLRPTMDFFATEGNPSISNVSLLGKMKLKKNKEMHKNYICQNIFVI